VFPISLNTVALYFTVGCALLRARGLTVLKKCNVI